MNLTEREKEIALECGLDPVAANLFLSRIRDEREAVLTVLVSDPEDERDGLSCTPKDWGKLCSLPPHTKLFTTPPAAPCDCSELVEALDAYDQIVRITISRLIRQYGKDNDEYAIELRECLGNACEALANHAKRMKG